MGLRVGAWHLEGVVLPGDWRVVARRRIPPGATGSNFSVGYIAEGPGGAKAFLKAMDYSRALQSADPAQALNDMTSAFLFERQLLADCGNWKLNRVVRALSSGSVQVPGTVLPTVQYLLFELADGDARSYVDPAAGLDEALVLRTLHNTAAAVDQLHRRAIAHQDVKPSNVLMFDGMAKLGDLGRASRRGQAALHDQFRIAGDPAYAPPEQLYGQISPDWNLRRFATDLYQLGSLAVFLFSNVGMTHALLAAVPESHSPVRWTGSYKDLLPTLYAALAKVLEALESSLSDPGLRRNIRTIVEQLCDPDPGRRGHPRDLASAGRQTSAYRYIVQFDRLARMAERRIGVPDRDLFPVRPSA